MARTPTRQSQDSRELNALHREFFDAAARSGHSPIEERFVWAVYNSGDPIWNDNQCSIELLLFETKATAISFVRSVLLNSFGVDTGNMSDDDVENLMWDNDTDRYLHLYELKVHPDNYLTVNVPF